MNRHPAPRTRQCGFTLLEVLVALVIMGLVLGGIFTEIQSQVDQRYRIQQRYVGQLAAWNRLMEEYRQVNGWARDPSRSRGRTEVLNRPLHWRITKQETFGEDLYRYETRVFTDADRDDTVTASLVAYFVEF
ncbi:MAG: prepilin-type N-terminal cleavage/methylation domain-containing protein [Cellvibrionales bacterium]|nr:prepilin-type N-terminal cleavage/methylation domain-containing protein [Cellvibrionales bacterium]